MCIRDRWYQRRVHGGINSSLMEEHPKSSKLALTFALDPYTKPLEGKMEFPEIFDKRDAHALLLQEIEDHLRGLGLERVDHWNLAFLRSNDTSGPRASPPHAHQYLQCAGSPPTRSTTPCSQNGAS
eukprot:TRINITY_DN1912_c0_g1_i1.p1 TRINITY_DN1912_c0_g1~~TRINITY_DN1912_c0_g1_i1.p1  ORF type:complete len:126 (-),score=26.75 TRINITY_DN1912_c0_g1_i1:613-990(-)